MSWPKDEKELSELPIDTVKDRIGRLDARFAPDTKKSVADDQLVDKTNVTDPDCGEKVETTEPTETVICEPRRSGPDNISPRERSRKREK